jgi:hypothetical protein
MAFSIGCLKHCCIQQALQQVLLKRHVLRPNNWEWTTRHVLVEVKHKEIEVLRCLQ